MRGKVIFRTIFGSRLYGTSGPNSDFDVKSVYLPLPEDMLCNTNKLTPVHSEYMKDGVKYDCENIPLQTFLRFASEGQTMAYDMLFAPKEMWLQEENEDFTVWEKHIAPNRKKFITQKCLNFVAYAIGQAVKYGKKGESLNILRQSVAQLMTVSDRHAPIRYIIENNSDILSFPYKIENGRNNERYIVIQNLYFPVGASVKTIIEGLENKIAKYGVRAEAAARSAGMDLKALSHAYRALCEAEELIDSKEIVFPLKNADKIKQIKYGNINMNAEDIANFLLSEAKRVEAKIKSSDLPLHASEYNSLIVEAYQRCYGTCLCNSVESQVKAMVNGDIPAIPEALANFAELQELLDTDPQTGEDNGWESVTEPVSHGELEKLL